MAAQETLQHERSLGVSQVVASMMVFVTEPAWQL